MIVTSCSRTPLLTGPLVGSLLLVLLTTAACGPDGIQDLLKGHGAGGSSPAGDAGVTPGKDGGSGPTSPCDAVSCPVGTHCAAVAPPCTISAKTCPLSAVCVMNTPPPPTCPPVCKIACPNGNVLDASGCPTCACSPPPVDPCSSVKCAAGTHCQADVVMCIKAPCPPITSCVPDAPRVFCGGIAGIACPGSGKCVDDPADGCDPAKGGADCGGLCSCSPVPCPSGAPFDGSPKVCACVPGGASDGGVAAACSDTRPCPPPPCACLDQNMDGKCDNACPVPACINGVCVNQTSTAILKEGESCGGFRPPSSPTCGMGLFCQHQPGALCGAADAGGICVKVIASCPTAPSKPVCGCDGKTYATACLATVSQVGILDLGGCK